MSSSPDVVTLAAASFTGELLRPSEAAYEPRRRVHNGAIDRRPAMIARCRGAADVVDAIRLARATARATSRAYRSVAPVSRGAPLAHG
jgi:hypothetical protein